MRQRRYIVFFDTVLIRAKKLIYNDLIYDVLLKINFNNFNVLNKRILIKQSCELIVNNSNCVKLFKFVRINAFVFLITKIFSFKTVRTFYNFNLFKNFKFSKNINDIFTLFKFFDLYVDVNFDKLKIF